jgi:hypothetical protein
MLSHWLTAWGVPSLDTGSRIGKRDTCGCENTGRDFSTICLQHVSTIDSDTVFLFAMIVITSHRHDTLKTNEFVLHDVMA